MNTLKITRIPLLGFSLSCFITLSQAAYATPPDGKKLDDCVQRSYSSSAFISGTGNFLMSLALGNALNNAVGQKVIDKNNKLEKAKDDSTAAVDAVANEDYMKHYAFCMRTHPEWQIESNITRRDFLSDSEKPTVTDNTSFIIDSLDGKSEIEFGESNVLTAKIRVYAPDKQERKLAIKHRIILVEENGYDTKLIREIPFPGEDREKFDLIDGIFTYRFGITLPPKNDKTSSMAGQELIYEMGLYHSGNLVDRRVLPFSIADIKKNTNRTP
ncbi:MAG: hypothetical protein NC112_06605 [Oxalobacter formigenes]|nr:hypothetical protein [Oxalobacter formigenes]